MTADDPRFAFAWIGGTVVLFLVAGVVGFVWLPSAQPGAGALDLWTVICRAVGLPIGNSQASVRGAGQPASDVAWTTATRGLLARGDAARGAAHRDAPATTVMGPTASAPTRRSRIWPAKAWPRSTSNSRITRAASATRPSWACSSLRCRSSRLLDLATHFASLPNPFAVAAAMPGSTDAAARSLVEVGSPMRSIASCAACHGPLGVTTGAPELRGQQRAYLEQQMQAFKAGNRHNDISEQMRSVARQLTGEEIAMLAAYYSSFAGAAGHKTRR